MSQLDIQAEANTQTRMSDHALLIGGLLRTTDKTLGIVNPANEQIFTYVPIAGEKELNDAVEAAQKAFNTFRHSSITERRELVNKIVAVLIANKDALAEALTKEQGKILGFAKMEVDFSVAFAQHFATMEIPDVEVLLENENQRVEQHYKPLGVVAGIVPWNFPLLIAIYKIVPALLTGNSIILKPAPTTPVATLMLGEFIKDVVPAGLVNILSDNNNLGPKITEHPGIAKISFTGSTATGKRIMASASGTLKRLTLELGGNDAAIVLDDVDPKAIAERIFGAAFINSGQVCIALKRLYVQEGVYDRLCDEIAALAKASVVGDGMDASSQFGPVQNKAQYEKVKGYIEDAKQHGTIIAGGNIPNKPGYHVPLTVVKDISDGTRVVDEEPFGPILPVIKFKDVKDALARANNSVYGLGASVWSSDLKKAHDIAEQMEAGTVWINQHCAFGPHIPFCGAKQSGLGVEWGKEGLREFTGLQVINISKV